MRNTLICTVGTSLINNLSSSAEPALREELQKDNAQALAIGLIGKDPGDRLCGAEINSNHGILRKDLISNRMFLYLLVSDTEQGRFTGKILKQYYGHNKNPWKFENVENRVIEGLKDSDPHSFRTEGLRNLVRHIAKIVQHHGSDAVLINATGGYKAQISFAGMIGQALEIPVCYLFERFTEVIVLPPQPVSLDMSFWMNNVELFHDLEKHNVEINPVSLDERFATLVDQVEVDGEILVGLSPVGQLFHETFRYRFLKNTKSLLPPDSGLDPLQKVIKYEDANQGRHRGLKDWLERLRTFSYVLRIYTHYYNPALAVRNYFGRSKTGEISQIEGGYSDGKATTKFDIVTTARTETERDAVLADLLSRLEE